MRVLLVAPFQPEAIRGNRVAAARIAAHLRGLGVTVDEREGGIAPDLVHGFQVWHSGARAAALAERFGRPLVLSFRGSDAEEQLEDPSRRARIAQAVERAQRVTALTRHHARKVAAELAIRVPIEVIGQGVHVAPSRRDWRRELDITASTPLLVQVTSVRRMKSFPQVLATVDRLHAAVPELRHVLAGPLLEPELARGLAQWFARRSWAHHAGPVAPADAQALARAATVTLHSGRREGTSNALLESLQLGTPALVLATPVTCELLQHGREALLYRDDAEAEQGLRRLVGDRGQASGLAAAGVRWAREHADPGREAAGYVACYERACADPGR